MKVIKNAIRCNLCGDEIESRSVHEYVVCRCGACSVDGGHEYVRIGAPNREAFTDLSVVVPDEE